MDLVQRYKNFIQSNDLFTEKDRLLLAVSGGVDSVVLCELCKQAGYDFVIAHCNFRLRDKESERDEEFVRALSKKYKVEVKVKEFETETYAEENKLSIQEAARKLRYDWFRELVGSSESGVGSQESGVLSQEPGILTIHGSFGRRRLAEGDARLTITLTAHHADDNIETLLMNFSRGTGLHGLTGIPVKSPYANVRRPLLGFWKEELVEFAKQHKLEYVEDSSNQSSKYTRNLFRNEIIPLLTNAYPQVKENLQDNINRFKEINKLYQLSVSDLAKKLMKVKGNEIHIPVKQLLSYKNKALVFEIISGFGFLEKQVDEVIKLMESESGRFIQSPLSPARIIKFRHWLIITTVVASQHETVVVEEGAKEAAFEIGNLRFEMADTSNFKAQTSNRIACLDLDEIQFPLILRKWKQGDYFYPLGMRKKKKLSRFFIDQKLSRTDKEKIWVVEMNKKIIWVVGHRIDERFKVTDKTKKVLKISLSA